jgi:hypothetical protein
MRVEPSDREARGLDAEASPQLARDHLAGAHDQLRRERRRNGGERDVNGDRDDLQVGPGEHHHRLGCDPEHLPREGAQELRMAGEGKTGILQGLLLDRTGHHCARRAVADQLD